MEANSQLFCESKSCERVDITDYKSLIGSLLQISITTRPDISFAVSQLTRYSNCPHKEHYLAAKRIVRYLKATIDYSIKYDYSDETLHGYADADWASNREDRKSISGYVYKLANGPIAYESTRQSVIAQSTTEAEYIAVCSAMNEGKHLKNLLGELGYTSEAKEPILLFNDNTSTIKLAKNDLMSKKTKHIDLRFHQVKENIALGHFRIEHMSTDGMPADILTKALTRNKHEKFCNGLGINCLRESVRGLNSN